MTQLMIDVTGRSLPGLLAALAGRYPAVLGGYVTGTPDIDWPAGFWTELAGHTGLFRFDQSPGLNLFTGGAADCADVEAGAATIEAAISSAVHREKDHGWYSWIYFSRSQLEHARQLAADAGLKKVRYVVADWSMNLAAASAFLAANPDTSAVQWASPSSNPGSTVPGTSRTLADLDVDLSVTVDGWFAPPKPPAPPRILTGVQVKFSDGSHVSYGD